jgi:L-arabinokinase
MKIAFYISGHGFGHATRMIAVMNAVTDLEPSAEFAIRTTVPERLFAANLRGRFAWSPIRIDVGLVQRDPLHPQPLATLVETARLHTQRDRLVAEEAAVLQAAGVRLVVADIPPLAFPIAAAAGVSGVGISNFSWDWVYAFYVRDHPGFAPLPAEIRQAHARADLFLRLPFHGDVSSFPRIEDIPIVVRGQTRSREGVRSLLRLPSDRPVVLMTFGGTGVDGLDLGPLRHWDNLCLLTTHPEAAGGSLRAIPPDAVPFQDLVAAVDVAVTKPGYGIVSECLASRTRMLYTSRGENPEYGPLVEGLTRYAAARFILPEDLFAGRWRPALEALLATPWPQASLPTNGAPIAARRLLDLIE